MKKSRVLFLFFALALAVSGGAFAQSDGWDSIYDGGDFMISASVGAYFPFNLVISPQLELIIAQIKIADIMPLDFGVAARGELIVGSTLRPGVGGLATVHLTFANLGNSVVRWLENFDIFVSLGLGVSIYPGSASLIELEFVTVEGFSYYLSESFALKIESSYWNFFGTSIGVVLKL